jgi:hypothetical protein
MTSPSKKKRAKKGEGVEFLDAKWTEAIGMDKSLEAFD